MANQRVSAVMQRFSPATYLGLVHLVLLVAIVGTIGSLIGRWWYALPSSSFGNVGDWVAGAAALAAILAIRIEAGARSRQTEVEAIAAAAEAADEIIEPSLSGLNIDSELTLRNHLRFLGRKTGNQGLLDAAHVLSRGVTRSDMPADSVYSGKVWTHGLRDDLRSCLLAIAEQVSPDPIRLDRISCLRQQHEYWGQRAMVLNDRHKPGRGMPTIKDQLLDISESLLNLAEAYPEAEELAQDFIRDYLVS